MPFNHVVYLHNANFCARYVMNSLWNTLFRPWSDEISVISQEKQNRLRARYNAKSGTSRYHPAHDATASGLQSQETEVTATLFTG